MSEPVIEKTNGFEDKLKLFGSLDKRSKNFLSTVVFAFTNAYQFCDRALLKLDDGTVCEVLDRSRKRPHEFPELLNINIKSISSSLHNIFLVSYDGHMYLRGSLSDDLSEDSFHLVKTSLPRVRKVRCGEYHVTVLTEDNQVYSWGSNEKTEAIGLKGKGFISEPEFVMKGVEDIDTGRSYSAALNTTGSVYIWGTLTHEMFYPQPTELRLDEKVKSFCAGQQHILLLAESGTIYTLGENQFGQCGVGTLERVVELAEIKNVKAESVYSDHMGWSSSCVTTEGKIMVWGWLRVAEQRVENAPIPEELDTCSCITSCNRVYGKHCSLGVMMKEPLRRYEEGPSEVIQEMKEASSTKSEIESYGNAKRSLRKRGNNISKHQESGQKKRRI